ncbi:hypothetical protein EBX93_15945, partial [bacterium]|nr:hypothetical protein [bacterium]
NVVLNAASVTTGSTFAASSNNLTITTDALALGNNVSGTGALVIQPKTDSTTFAIGTAATGTLALTDTELGYLIDGFSSITLGSSAGTAAVNVNYAAASFTFADPLILRSATGNITATDALKTGTNALTLSTGGNISLVGVNSGALSVTGAAITLNNDITTSGSQSYTGPVTLANNIALDSGTSGAVSFSSTVNSASTTARDLNISAGSGNVTFTGAVGGTYALGAIAVDTTGTTTFGSSVNAASLTTNAGGTTVLNSSVTTTGAQTYNDAVILNGSLVSTGSTITTANTIDAANNSLTLVTDILEIGGSINGGSGTITIKPLTTSTSIGLGDGATGDLNLTNTELGYINTTGNYFATIVIGDSANGSGVIQYNTNGTTLAYGSALTLQQASGGIVLENSITTTGAQTYIGAVSLSAGITLTTSNGAVGFSSTINNSTSTPRALTVSTGSGNVTFSGIIGGGANGAIGALRVNSTGTTTFSAAVYAASLITNIGGTTEING